MQAHVARVIVRIRERVFRTRNILMLRGVDPDREGGNG
jgi:hypothetical protein